MYFQPWYLENWDMYFPEGVQNEFGYFEGPSFALTRDQEIMYSGKNEWMLIETRFMLFSGWTLRVIPGMPCHIILTKKKERKKEFQTMSNRLPIDQFISKAKFFWQLVLEEILIS